MLIVLSGLPGVGKTAIASELAPLLCAVHIRIDSIEQAIRESGVVAISLDDAGYRVGYAVAEDNLRLGRIVIADSVNPWPVTREAWREVAVRAQAAVVDVEVICTDHREHRRRVEQRLPGGGPTWEEVVSRDYRAWDRDHVVIDTAGRSVGQCVAQLRGALPAPLVPSSFVASGATCDADGRPRRDPDRASQDCPNARVTGTNAAMTGRMVDGS
jgi:predicted kinase